MTRRTIPRVHLLPAKQATPQPPAAPSPSPAEPVVIHRALKDDQGHTLVTHLRANEQLAMIDAPDGAMMLAWMEGKASKHMDHALLDESGKTIKLEVEANSESLLVRTPFGTLVIGHSKNMIAIHAFAATDTDGDDAEVWWGPWTACVACGEMADEWYEQDGLNGWLCDTCLAALQDDPEDEWILAGFRGELLIREDPVTRHKIISFKEKAGAGEGQ
jgi:hypothetical protein